MVTEIASKYIRADSTAEGKSKMNYWYKEAIKLLDDSIMFYEFHIKDPLTFEDRLFKKITNSPNTPMATKKKVVAKKATPKKKVVAKKKK